MNGTYTSGCIVMVAASMVFVACLIFWALIRSEKDQESECSVC